MILTVLGLPASCATVNSDGYLVRHSQSIESTIVGFMQVVKPARLRSDDYAHICSFSSVAITARHPYAGHFFIHLAAAPFLDICRPNIRTLLGPCEFEALPEPPHCNRAGKAKEPWTWSAMCTCLTLSSPGAQSWRAHPWSSGEVGC